MNKRIKELALEARIAYYSKNSAYEGADEGLSVIPSTQSLEKFAELIVRECALALDETIAPTSHPFNSIGWKLKEHFGVKE